MKISETGQQWRQTVGMMGVVVCMWWLAACSTSQPKPASPMVTPDEVRSHADRAFDRLRQEEREQTEREATPLSVPSADGG